MDLNDLIKSEGELLSEFLKRTYWTGYWKNPKIWVYKDSTQKGNFQVWSRDKAIRYCDSLYDDTEPKKQIENAKLDREVNTRNILMKVSEEKLGFVPHSFKWIDVDTGEVKHEVKTK